MGKDYIWYNAEFDHFKIGRICPCPIYGEAGWKEYTFWALPKRKGINWYNLYKYTNSPTGLTEYVYIGEL